MTTPKAAHTVAPGTVTINFHQYFGGSNSEKPHETTMKISEPQQPLLQATAARMGPLDGCKDVADLCVLPAKEARYHRHIGNIDYYQIVHRPKGNVLVINNAFWGKKNERKGSQKDVENLTTFWSGLGAIVTVVQELTAAEIKSRIEQFLASLSEDVDFCVVFVLSHGKKGDLVVGVDSTPVEAEILVNLFGTDNCPRLKGKPKLLFFQMCRGAEINRRPRDPNSSVHSVGVDHPDHGEDDDSDEEDPDWLVNEVMKCLPHGRILGRKSSDVPDAMCFDSPDLDERAILHDKPDMMLTFATRAGEIAFLNKATGSWLVNSLCNAFGERARDTDVLEMMETVNDNVKKERARASGKPYDGGRSDPITTTTLTKKLMFFPGFPKF